MWQIIGAGAIGCLWAVNLLKSGQNVHLVSKNMSTFDNLHYQNIKGENFNFECSISNNLLPQKTPILVCVKAPQVKQALLKQRDNICQEQVIILMHNGMGTAEQIADIFPNNPIICATTANASLLISPFNIKQTGLGVTYLGAFNVQAKPVAELIKQLNNALDDCYWSDDIEQKLWLKLIINIAINPLTAIYQVNNGKLSEQQFQSKITTIIKEAAPVFIKQGVTFTEEELFIIINNVITATAGNYSSMNRDIFLNRPTENEYINGYLLKKASQYNIETPLIKSLYEQIKVLENHSLTAQDIH